MSGEEAWVDFCSGWVSGGVSVLACQPIDTVLTRMQANAGVMAGSTSNAKMIAPPINHSVSGGAVSVNIFRGMISNFGITSLWRGSSAMIGAIPLQNALLMTGYGAGKRWSESSNGGASKVSNISSNITAYMGVFIGGCVGGVLQSFVMSPVSMDTISLTNLYVGMMFNEYFLMHPCTNLFHVLYITVGGADKSEAASSGRKRNNCNINSV